MNRLELIFYSKVRAEVFRLLFGLNANNMYLGEIESITGFANRSIQEELNKLRKLELLVKTRDRSRVYYAANQEHPLYAEIRSIVLKTSGLKDILSAALQSNKIEYAFVFGSLAQQSDRAESDVDLMIIGELTNRELASLLRGAADQIGREINPHIFSHEELSRRLSEKDHFVADVLGKPKLFIKGDEHEFAAIVADGLAATAQDKP